MSIIFIFLINIINPILLLPSCKEGINNCYRCNPLTKLCDICILDVYTPDNNGGCIPAGKCVAGNNYCKNCDEEGKKCRECEKGLYPDKNGGCSFDENCEISYRGNCLQCKEDYILVGEDSGFKICKLIFSDDLKNCEKINSKTGLCDLCKEGYFLDNGDKKCSNIQNCYESMFGKCIKCNNGFYLNIKENNCKSQTGSLLYCKESFDDEICDTCDDDFFFDEKGVCTNVKYCSESYLGCQKCIKNYYLTKDGGACTQEKNCYSGDKLNGLCNYCVPNYYLDLKDRKCKSNKEDYSFFHCIKVENGVCSQCENDYNLSEDKICTLAKNCAEVDEDGKCILCSENYHLGLDNICTNISHCIYSEVYYDCKECEDGYYFNTTSKLCLKYIEGFENCKLTTVSGNDTICYYCKNGFYMNQTDHLCYNNKEKDDNFYKCLLTDMKGEKCIKCEDNYYIGYKDYKCSKIYGCDKSENEDLCSECNDRHCLNVKTGKCESNELIENEDDKFYYRCIETNEEGNACEKCLDGFELSEDGFCVDKEHCIEEEDDVCIRCLNNRKYSSCLNKYFGCVPTSYMKCIECNNNLDFDVCTKCRDDYELDEDGVCIEIQDD